MTLLAGTAAAAVLAAGCGGGEGGFGPIPESDANEMLNTIEQIRSAQASQDCETAQASTTELSHQVGALGGGDTKTALTEMVSRLDEELDDECPPTGTTGPEEIDARPEEETQIEPTTTTSVPTTTTTETTTTEPEEEPAPPEEPPGHGQGGGQGQVQPPGQGGAPPAGGIEPEERDKPKRKKPKKGKG